MKEGFVFLRGGHGLSTPLLVDQWHTAEGIISLGWLMMASTHRCLSCLSWGWLGVRLTLAPLPLALTTCRHLRWAAFFPPRHQVSDVEEWTGKPLCLVRGREKLMVVSGTGWWFTSWLSSGFVKITDQERMQTSSSQSVVLGLTAQQFENY